MTILENLEQLKSQIKQAGKEPTDELILATLLQTLPEAFDCIRLFAASMSIRLQERQQEK